MRACCAIFVFLGCSLKADGAETTPIAATAPDPAQLIAESGALQKRPEPEMTESEQVVYDKVAPIMARRPPFALKLLKGMSKSSDPDAKPSPAFEFMLANAYHASARYAEAEACYQRCLAQSPSFIRAWSNLGVLYYVQNRYQDAVPCFSKAVTLGDRDPATFGMLGNVLEKTGNSVSAEMAYMQALAANPAEANWSEGLLRLYIDNKHTAKAEALVLALLANHPEDPRYWQTHAHILLTSGRKHEAIANLERMTAVGLAREADLILLGDLYIEHRMTPEALATFGRVSPTQPEVAQARLLKFVRVLIGARAWPDALTVLETLARAPLNSQGRVLLLEARADLELARQNWIGAKSALEALLAEAPDRGSGWLGLAQVYLAEAEQAKALNALQRAYAIPESSYRASLELTNIEFKNHHYEQCLHYLEHALTLQRTAAVENFRDQIKKLIPTDKPSKP